MEAVDRLGNALVAVEWEDVTADTRTAIPDDFEQYRLRKLTCGILWKETDDYIVVVGDYDITNTGKDYRHNDFQVIPRGVIRQPPCRGTPRRSSPWVNWTSTPPNGEPANHGSQTSPAALLGSAAGHLTRTRPRFVSLSTETPLPVRRYGTTDTEPSFIRQIWRPVMYLRAELYCYFCGHGSGEVLVATTSRRPTPEQLKAAYSAITGPRAPVWDAGEQPLCPRCGGQLFLERYELQTVRRRAPLKKAS